MSDYPEETIPRVEESVLPIAAGIAGDLRRWPVFLSLHLDFAKTVRLCCVFGDSGASALFVTQNEEVWALGGNANGCLGIGAVNSCSNLVKIPELSGKSVQSFAYGRKHVLALTSKGEIYGWGDNNDSQLGRAAPDEIFNPTLVFNGNDPVLEISCGKLHSACRTISGAVYCWGSNRYGQLGTGDRAQPQSTIRKVEWLIAHLKCIGISCSSYSTVALFENGEVYAWGANYLGTLGNGSASERVTVPAKVLLDNAVIHKIACGDCHFLALADDGTLYSWGSNDEGQLGTRYGDKQLVVFRHPTLKEHGRILDLAASGKTSAVMTNESRVLMWGSRANGSVRNPTEVSCDSVQDVFAELTDIAVTPVPLIVTPMSAGSFTANSESQKSYIISAWGANLLNPFAELFDNPSLSDVKFLVEEKAIHVHKTILKFQSEYLSNMLEGPWKEITADSIELSDFSYPVYRAFFKFFYTGEIHVSDAEALALFELASSSSENLLKEICQKRIEKTISVENCASVYLTAVRSGAEDLEEICISFAKEHMSAVSRTKAFAALPEDMSTRFLAGTASRVHKAHKRSLALMCFKVPSMNRNEGNQAKLRS